MVGEDLEIPVDAKRYLKGATWTFLPQPDLDLPGAKLAEEKGKGSMDRKGDVF